MCFVYVNLIFAWFSWENRKTYSNFKVPLKNTTVSVTSPQTPRLQFSLVFFNFPLSCMFFQQFSINFSQKMNQEFKKLILPHSFSPISNIRSSTPDSHGVQTPQPTWDCESDEVHITRYFFHLFLWETVRTTKKRDESPKKLEKSIFLTAKP